MRSITSKSNELGRVKRDGAINSGGRKDARGGGPMKPWLPKARSRRENCVEAPFGLMGAGNSRMVDGSNCQAVVPGDNQSPSCDVDGNVQFPLR